MFTAKQFVFQRRWVRTFCVSITVGLVILAASIYVLARPLTSDRFVVDADNYRFWVFEVGRSAGISGQFRVEGSGDTEVRVLIMDEAEFDNYRNGRGFRVYYASDRVSGGEINLRLYSGRYVIVFDNTFSHYASKTVSSNLQITED
jgi:emp24/gp25L/p24 family/GOLD